MNCPNSGSILERSEVLFTHHLSRNFFILALKWRGERPIVGQFFVLTSRKLSHPVPLTFFDGGDGTIKFLVKVAGENTRTLSRMSVGTPINLLGPCGNGFVPSGRVAGVGGGSGIAALYPLPPDSKVLIGTKEEIPPLFHLFSRKFKDLRIAVEERGKTVVDLLSETEKSLFEECETTLLCGPKGMLREIKRREMKIPKPFVVVESVMGCGMGVCLGCTVETVAGLKKACTDGPVFPMEVLKL
jgi:dihydroorotate dehydrogenase electron transfer subunit